MGKLVLLFTLLFSLDSVAAAQAEVELLARGRVFPEFGPGVTAFKRDAAGRYFILLARGPLYIVSPEGKTLAQIPPADAAEPAGKAPEAPSPGKAPSSSPSAFLYADDFDVASSGQIYIADRGANAVKVFSPTGALLRTISVEAPNSVAALPEGEVAVTSAAPGAPRTRNPRLITVYDAAGKLAREFGDPIEIALRNEVNRLLGIGRLLSDARGQLYYAYTFFPEPSLRRYDRFGYTTLEIVLATPEFQPTARAVRREIKKQDEKGGRPSLLPVVHAHGVDPERETIWLAVDNVLLQFDRDGGRLGSYRLFTHEGARLVPVAIVVEADRLLVANDPLGIYEFPRPDKLPR